jgi:hemoglobin
MTTPTSDPDHHAPEECPIADSEKARTLVPDARHEVALRTDAVPAPAPSVSSHAGITEVRGASEGSAVPRHNPHFELVGGEEGIARLVDRFYHHMQTLPEAATILAMHPHELGAVKAVLVRFLTEWMGGPQVYSRERGHPRLRRRHLPFSIGAAERDAWMTCMTRALTDTIADVGLREQLTQAFLKTANFLRNDEGTSHDHHRSHTAQQP